jgi:hypothetical protein
MKKLTVLKLGVRSKLTLTLSANHPSLGHAVEKIDVQYFLFR